jgi:hypothetical protein
VIESWEWFLREISLGLKLSKRGVFNEAENFMVRFTPYFLYFFDPGRRDGGGGATRRRPA